MAKISRRAAPILVMGLLLAAYVVLAAQAFHTGYWVNSGKILLAAGLLFFLAVRAWKRLAQ
jgi:hypothetical protein